MKGQLKVSSPAEYIAQLEEPRRSEIAASDAMIPSAALKLEPVIQPGMLAYGPFYYKHASGREGDSSRIALASNKNYISLYINAAERNESVAERFKAALPKTSIGKNCVRFKKLSGLDETTLKQMTHEAATQHEFLYCISKSPL